MAGCSILEQRDVDDKTRAHSRSALRELAQTSKQFCKILCRYSSEVNSGIPVCEQLFDEFLTVTLPPGSRNPLTLFSGIPENPVVIVSQSPQATKQEDLPDDSTCEEPEPKARLQLEELILLIRSSTVNVGQPFTERLEFLTCSQPFHHQGEESDPRVSQALHVRDVGLLPVTMERARFVCSLYHISCLKWPSETLPDLWVLCQDRSSTIAMGCSQHCGSSSVRLLEVAKAGIVHLPSGLAGTKKPSLSTCGKLKPHERSNSTAYCEYEVISADNELTPSDLQVQFTWGEVEHHLCPPPETSVAVVKVSTKPGHMGSSVLGLYEEVLTLLNLCLVVSGEAKWTETAEGLETSTPLVSQLDAFFAATGFPLAHPEEDLVQQSADSSSFHARKNLDFVERLWLFCKDVQSISDLQEVLAAVFKAVLFRKVHPWIHQNSTTPLADAFRQSLLCTTSDEIRALGSKMEAMLNETKVLDYLVQSGIEKLRRDYHNCFRGHGLVTEMHLDPFMHGTTILESCYNLCKLHSVLELVGCVLNYLNLPLPLLSQLTREALQVYAHLDFCGFESTPVFSLPVPAHSSALRSLTALCSSLVPRVWSVCTKAGPQDCQMTVYTSEPLFRHLTVDNKCNDSVTDLYVYKGCCSTV